MEKHYFTSILEIGYEVIGWGGALAVVLAYALVSLKKVAPDDLSFQFLNLIGGLFLVLYTVHNATYASAFVNIVWVGVAVFSLILNKKKA